MREEEIVQDIILRSYIHKISPYLVVPFMLKLGFSPEKCYDGVDKIRVDIQSLDDIQCVKYVKDKLEALESN